MALINAKQASDHLRLGLDFGDYDPATDVLDPEDYPEMLDLPDLLDKMAQAEAIVLDYLKVGNQSPAWTPPAQDEQVVRSATLLILGSLWRDREDNSLGGGGTDMLSPNGTVTRLLMRLRDPAIA